MHEPALSPDSPPEATRPFTPESPRTIPGGCTRAGLIGCGVLTLLLGVAAVLFLLKAGDLFAWAMGKFESEIMRTLPDDFTEAERRRLQEAFAAASKAVQRGDADPLALQRLQEHLRKSVLVSDRTLTRSEALELVRVLEEVAGAREENPTELGDLGVISAEAFSTG